MASTTRSTYTKKYNLRTPNTKLLMLENDGTLSVNGNLQDFLHSSVLFYLDIKSNSLNQRIVKIQPVNEKSKFLAVSGTTVVLKDQNNVADNSHSFIERAADPDDDYKKYQVIASPSNAQTFITADQSGAVIIAGDSASDKERAWFQPQLIINKSAPVTTSAAHFILIENISDKVTISEKGTISEDVTITDKVTISKKGTIFQDVTISGMVRMPEE